MPTEPSSANNFCSLVTQIQSLSQSDQAALLHQLGFGTAEVKADIAEHGDALLTCARAEF